MKTILVATLIVIGSYAQAQQTEGEREAAAREEIERSNAMLRDLADQLRDLNKRDASPREVIEYCQKALPKLDEIFRIEMMYAPPELKLEFQNDYVVVRQKILNDLVDAQLALASHPDQ
jgi:hypothetical protein